MGGGISLPACCAVPVTSYVYVLPGCPGCRDPSEVHAWTARHGYEYTPARPGQARPDRSLCRPHTTASIASSPGPDDTRTSPWSSHQATTSRLMPYLHLALVTTGRTRQGGIHGARMTMCLHGRIGGKMSSFAPPRPALPPLFPGRAAWPTCEERRGGREADPICRAVSALSDLWAGAGRIAEAGVVRGWVTW